MDGYINGYHNLKVRTMVTHQEWINYLSLRLAKQCPMRNRVLTRIVNKTTILAALIGGITCAPDEICFTDNDTRVKIDFNRILFPGTDSALVETDTLIIFQITAPGPDSVFLSQDTVTNVILPVNTLAEATTFVFDTDQGVKSLELTYQRTQRLISVDCGPEQIIDELAIGETTFDSLEVVQPSLFEQPNTNVEVYR